MYSMLMIAFREDLEAFLIVVIGVTFLRQTGRAHLLPALRWGVGVALVLCTILVAILTQTGGFTPLWEGSLALVAAVLVISCTVRMLHHGKAMAREITTRL